MAVFIKFRFKYFNSCTLFFILSNCAISFGFLNVFSPVSSVIEADYGSRIVVPCNVSGRPRPLLTWLKNGQLLALNSSREQPWLDEGGLLFHYVLQSHAGNYTCLASNVYDLKEVETELIVKTPPGKLQNVTVHPSTVVATVRWHVEDDGGYSITNFTLIYRPTNASASEAWHVPQPVHISPAMRQFFVYHLRPGTEYAFKMWASNALGPGEAITVHASTCKPLEAPEMLSKMMGTNVYFGNTAWLLAVTLTAITVISVCFVAYILIMRNKAQPLRESSIPRITPNPGFDIEHYYLLDHADFNDNFEKPIRLNNNTVVQPSDV